MRRVLPNPRLDRQLDPDGPALLWRDREGGRRDGLMIVTWVCPFPGCPDRHVEVAAYRLDGTAGPVELDEVGVWTVEHDGLIEELEPAFTAAIALDDAQLEPDPFAPPDLVDWLRRELDPELVALFRGRFERARARTAALFRALRPLPPWRAGPGEPCSCGTGRVGERWHGPR